MRPDRLHFEQYDLSNGITVFHRSANVGYTCIRIIVPIGGLHDGPGLKPGVPHVGEHLAFNRSQAYPERHSYSRELELMAGMPNAYTGSCHTVFSLDIPNDVLDVGFTGLLSAVFEPIVTAEDVDKEKDVIKSERLERGEFYPTSSSLSHALISDILGAIPITRDRMFGTPEQIDQFNLDDAQSLFQHYHSRGIIVVIVGVFPRSALKILKRIATIEPTTTLTYPIPAIKTGVIHSLIDPQSQGCAVYLMSAQPMCTADVSSRVLLLQNYLTWIHGPLMQWLRNESGWIYSLQSEHVIIARLLRYGLRIRVRTMDQAKSVIAAIDARVRRGLSATQELRGWIDMVERQWVYFLKTSEDITEAAVTSLISHGNINSETAFRTLLDRARTEPILLETWEKMFEPSRLGVAIGHNGDVAV